MELSNFRVLTFDCYGTLIDWEKGILEALLPLTRKMDPPLSDDQILQAHARLESDQEIRTPSKLYRDILAIVYRRLAEEWRIPVSWYDCMQYGKSIGRWIPFPDSVKALRYLKRHFKLVILSNVDHWSFSASNARLNIEFDAVFTAEEIGYYKPSDQNFDFLISRLAEMGFAKDEILHTAQSLFHDHVPANRHGLKTCWINRRHNAEGFGATPLPTEMPQLDFTFGSLAEMVETHKLETKR